MKRSLKISLSALLLVGLFTWAAAASDVTVLAGPDDKFVSNENGFDIYANVEGRHIKLFFVQKSGHSAISAASGISTKPAECPFRGNPVLLTVRVSDHQVDFIPSGGTPTECGLVPAMGSSVEGLMKAAIKSQYVDLQIGESVAASDLRGWYRVAK